MTTRRCRCNVGLLAEREGFEPSDPVSQVNSLAVSPIRPLSHLSRVKHPSKATDWRTSEERHTSPPEPRTHLGHTLDRTRSRSTRRGNAQTGHARLFGWRHCRHERQRCFRPAESVKDPAQGQQSVAAPVRDRSALAQLNDAYALIDHFDSPAVFTAATA